MGVGGGFGMTCGKNTRFLFISLETHENSGEMRQMPPSKRPQRTKPVREQPEREHRILYQIVVDAYNDTERAMGWYYYLKDAMQVPFNARCMSEVFVTVKHGRSTLAAPLAQLECRAAHQGTLQAVEDWHYWVGRRYQY